MEAYLVCMSILVELDATKIDYLTKKNGQQQH